MEILFGKAISFLLALVISVCIVSATENGVLLKDSDYQRITSNTLKWVSPSPPGSIPQDAVVGSVEYVALNKDAGDMRITDRSQLKEYKIYICRAFLEGIWVPGAVFEHTKLCIVTMTNKVQQAEQYDILINIDQAARLVWQDWERLIEVPRGAVFAGDYFIAHTASSELDIISETLAIGMVYRIGKIDPTEGIFGKMSVVNEKKELVYDVASGQVLVEIQPIFYELTVTNLTRTREKILNHRTLKLGGTTLRNNEDREMKAESVIPYQWKYESNWGQGRAMSKALETRIQFQNSTPIQTISWGIPYVEMKDCIEKVEKILPAGTASRVEVNSVLSEKEVPFTGILLSVFGDSNTMNRTIHGIWKYTDLTDITTTYGPSYFMNNNSLVPTTTTTTTDAPSSTIATTTWSIVKSTFTPEFKNDQSNAINEDSDAMLLEKKEDDKSNSLKASHFQFPIVSFVFVVFFCSYVREC